MRQHVRTAFRVSILAALFAAPAGGQFDPDNLPGQRALPVDQLVQMRVVSDAASIGPAQRFRLAVIFDLEDHWHIYWRFSGDAGLPTELDVTTPEGFTVGETLYPRPAAFREPEGMTFGYEEQVVLFVPVTAPGKLTEGEATFEVGASFLVCRGRCLLGDAESAITVPTTAQAKDDPPAKGPDATLLARFTERLPRPLNKLEDAAAGIEDGRLVVTGPCPGRDRVEFFPLETPGVRLDRPDITVADGRFRIVVKISARPQNARGKPMSVAGVIGLGGKSDEPCYHFELPLEMTGRP
jgi:thiol:disulfide interchange protein DsbD